jgi:hypothetical protein
MSSRGVYACGDGDRVECAVELAIAAAVALRAGLLEQLLALGADEAAQFGFDGLRLAG